MMWSMLLLFGALQGCFLATTLLFHKRGNKTSNRLLAILLLLFSLHLGEYVFLATGFYREAPHLIGITWPVVFLIGPLYYFYAVSLLRDDSYLDAKLARHFVPAVLCYLLLFPFYSEPASTKAEILAGVIANGYVIFPLAQFTLMALSTVQMLAYFYLTFTLLQGYEENLKAASASAEILNLEWLKKISFVLSLYTMVFFVAYFQLFLLKAHRQEIFYVAVLALSFFIHAVSYHAIKQPEIFSESKMKPVSPKYHKTALPEGRSKIYLEKLLALMKEEKPFLNSELKLTDIAEALQILPNHLSQVINAELNKNFFDFINEYRVTEAQSRLRDPQFQHYSILAVALEAGFNNKASFNRVFKKQTGMTPSEYARREGEKNAAGMSKIL